MLTSIKTSEQPFATVMCSSKSAVPLTMAKSFTTRTARSKEPNVFLNDDKIVSPTCLQKYDNERAPAEFSFCNKPGRSLGLLDAQLFPHFATHQLSIRLT